MLRTLVILLFAASALGCAQNMIAANYVTNRSTVVPASFSQLEITQLLGFEDAKHPGKLYVAPPSQKRLEISLSGRETQWSAMLPLIEAVYRDAAMQVLKERGHDECVLESPVPLPKEFGIEYAYRCAS